MGSFSGAGECLMSFGAIADIQYADIDDKWNFHKTCFRRYRNSFQVLDDAVDYWNKGHGNTVQCVLQLGDVLDYYNKKLKLGTDKVLERLLEKLEKIQGVVYHVWGNHEVMCFSHSALLTGPLNSSALTGAPQGDIKGYYTFSPHEKLCFIVLDMYEFAMIGHDRESQIYKDADALLRAKNPNIPRDYHDASGLQSTEQRFVKFNGGVSAEQLQWLDSILSEAQQKNQHVIVAGHTPIHVDAAHPKYISWSCHDILRVLHKYSCVVAFLAGHHHAGGYVRDVHGIHHLTLHGNVEADQGICDFATFDVYNNRIEVLGNGRIPSRTLMMKED